ncbi:MAG: hypothetical protein R6U37_05490 [Dehalococcoidia bacterium]
MTRILLTGPFKPFAVDNIYSRKESIPELFHNQLTHFQGIYSPRMDFPTHGLHLIAANVPEDVTVLEWPTLERFEKEVKKGYDYVGIGSIAPNLQKVKKMTETVRLLSPRTKIMIGGFCAMIPDLDKLLEADYVCVGEGISFVRELLGHSPEFDFVHPDITPALIQVLGIHIRNYVPAIVTSLGCSRGCDFCCTTHFFGKKHITLMHTGREIFNEMERLEGRFKSTAFNLTGDDNFLLDSRRALELHDCIVESGKPYSYGVFASADLCKSFGPRKLAEMGIDSVWIGRESKFSSYAKTRGVDVKELIDELADWGIWVILSSIILMDCHTEDNIWEDIDDHIACRPAFSQFAPLSPAPVTPLWDRMDSEGRILRFIPIEEWHGFKQPWVIHPHFTLMEAEALQRQAYEKDFLTLGPGIARMAHTVIRGYMNFKQTDSPPLLARAREIEKHLWLYKAAMYDMELLADNPQVKEVIRELRKDMERMVGKLSVFEKAVAGGGFLAGSYRKLRNRLFSDVIQPRTRVFHYPANWTPSN